MMDGITARPAHAVLPSNNPQVTVEKDLAMIKLFMTYDGSIRPKRQVRTKPEASRLGPGLQSGCGRSLWLKMLIGGFNSDINHFSGNTNTKTLPEVALSQAVPPITIHRVLFHSVIIKRKHLRDSGDLLPTSPVKVANMGSAAPAKWLSNF